MGCPSMNNKTVMKPAIEAHLKQIHRQSRSAIVGNIYNLDELLSTDKIYIPYPNTRNTVLVIVNDFLDGKITREQAVDKLCLLKGWN